MQATNMLQNTINGWVIGNRASLLVGITFCAPKGDLQHWIEYRMLNQEPEGLLVGYIANNDAGWPGVRRTEGMLPSEAAEGLLALQQEHGGDILIASRAWEEDEPFARALCSCLEALGAR